MLVTIVEQRRLLRRTNQVTRQRARLHPPLAVELPQLRDRALNDPPADSHALHQPPVAMDLAVLLPRRRTQVHAPITTDRPPLRKGQGRHYTAKSALAHAQLSDRIDTHPAKIARITATLRKLG